MTLTLNAIKQNDKQITNLLLIHFGCSCANVVFCLLVVWNLVVIAVERYLAVCQPFKHNELTKKKAVFFFVLIYIAAIIFNFTTAFDVSYIQSRFPLGQVTISLIFLQVKSFKLPLSQIIISLRCL